MRLLVAAGAIGLGLVMPALAVELFVGRWAVSAGTAVYLLVHCGGEGDVPVTFATQGDRRKVTWNRAQAVDLQRCK